MTEVCFNAWYDESSERVPEARRACDYFTLSFSLNRKIYMRREKGEGVKRKKRKKRIYMPITFSTIVQQHSSDAIYFPTLLSDDPITCTCQQKENLNAIRHDKGLANQ